MSKPRHVYRPPRGRYSGIFAIIGGVIATLLVFIAIPLSQKLADMTTPAPIAMPEPEAAPPPEQELVMEEPPPEEPEEEPPEPPPESAPNLDMALDVDLSLGAPGSVVLNIPTFAMNGADDAFGSGDLQTPPRPYVKTQPVYPSKLLNKGIGGKVEIACVVDANGGVVSTKVRKSSGNSSLDQAALKAVRKWKFKPAVSGGKKVKATCVVPFNFEIKR